MKLQESPSADIEAKPVPALLLATGLLTLIGAGSTPPALAQSQYDVIELTPNSIFSGAFGINNGGQVVGQHDARPFMWSPGTGWKHLTTEVGTAWDINDAGTVVGDVTGASGTQRLKPFMWKNSTGFQLLEPADSDLYGSARAVNNDDVSVGFWDGDSSGLDEKRFPAMWSPSKLGLSSVSGFVVQHGEATDVIDTKTAPSANHYPVLMFHNTHLLGGTESEVTEGWLWDGVGAPYELDPATAGKTVINPIGPNIISAHARAMNESGQIVGNAIGTPPPGTMTIAFERSFLYDSAKGTNIWLGDLGGLSSFARDINERGQVVGWGATTGSGFARSAFIWDADNGMRDLNLLVDPSLGLTLEIAQGINDSGQIIANSSNMAFLLTPIPEPGAYALMAGAGLLCFTVRRRGRVRRKVGLKVGLNKWTRL